MMMPPSFGQLRIPYHDDLAMQYGSTPSPSESIKVEGADGGMYGHHQDGGRKKRGHPLSNNPSHAALLQRVRRAEAQKKSVTEQRELQELRKEVALLRPLALQTMNYAEAVTIRKTDLSSMPAFGADVWKSYARYQELVRRQLEDELAESRREDEQRVREALVNLQLLPSSEHTHGMIDILERHLEMAHLKCEREKARRLEWMEQMRFLASYDELDRQLHQATESNWRLQRELDQKQRHLVEFVVRDKQLALDSEALYERLGYFAERFPSHAPENLFNFPPPTRLVRPPLMKVNSPDPTIEPQYLQQIRLIGS